jgi:hypothetical protein
MLPRKAPRPDETRRQPGAFVDDTPTATLIRQLLGAVAQFDKAMVSPSCGSTASAKAMPSAKGENHTPTERPEVFDLVKRMHN